MKYLFSFTLTLVTCFSGLCQSDAIDAFIASKMKTKKIPGLQLVITKNNKIIKNASYGIANIEDGVKVDATTTFAINSMTKAFTGVAVMQ